MFLKHDFIWGALNLSTIGILLIRKTGVMNISTQYLVGTEDLAKRVRDVSTIYMPMFSLCYNIFLRFIRTTLLMINTKILEKRSHSSVYKFTTYVCSQNFNFRFI